MKSHFLPVADLEMSMFVCSARARIFAEGLRVQSRTAVLRNFCQTSAVTESSAQIYRTDVSDTRYTEGGKKCQPIWIFESFKTQEIYAYNFIITVLSQIFTEVCFILV